MHDIALICSMHKEIGKCNSKELYEIIKRADPEVIFEEFDISRTEDEYYKNGHYKYQDKCTVETAAIMKYLENHQVVHIPVDIYDAPDPRQNMYSKISSASEEYINLVKMNFILSCQHGFSYINSSECYNSLEKIRFIEEEIIRISDDKILCKAYRSWQLVMENRDNEMIRNIYEYSKNHCYNNAIFIVGVDHRDSIMKKIKEYEERNELKLNWNYDIYKNV